MKTEALATREEDEDREQRLVAYNHQFANPILAKQAQRIYRNDDWRQIGQDLIRFFSIMGGFGILIGSVILGYIVCGPSFLSLLPIFLALVILWSVCLTALLIKQEKRFRKIRAKQLIADDEKFRANDQKILGIEREQLLTKETKLLEELKQCREKRGELDTRLGLSAFRDM